MRLPERPKQGTNPLKPIPAYSVVSAQDFYERVVDDIHQATQNVDLHFYITQKDKKTKSFFNALENAARRGVRVRFVIDRLTATTIIPTYKDFLTRLEIRRLNGLNKKEHLPIEVRSAKQKNDSINPLRRSHKKFMVIDTGTPNAHGYVGGTNMAGFFYNWRDSMAYVQGDVANTLEKDFEKTWRRENIGAAKFSTGNPSDKTEILTDDKLTGKNMERFLQELSRANHTIWIETTYLKGKQLTKALGEAKKRNPDIDIKLLVPYPRLSNDPSYRFFSFYWLNPLVRAGVEVYLYGRREKQFTHAKNAIIDDLAIIGSSNFVNGVVVGGNAEMIMLSKNPYFYSQTKDWLLSGIEKSDRYEIHKSRNKKQ